ncbi:MAG TPA: OstA-like protein [Chitinophagaceae bacterium]
MLLTLLPAARTAAQTVITADTAAATSILQIIAAKRYNFEKKDSANFISLAGDVQLKKENTLFYCDSAVLNQQQNVVEAFGHVHINDADSVHTYSDYMRYVGKERKAYLRNNVRLTDGKSTLTTNELEYEISTKIGQYFKGGKVVTGKSVLTSSEGTYYGDTRDAQFRKNVVLVDPEYRVTTDTLLYNMETAVARFVAYTVITSKDRVIKTREGYYDQKNRKAIFSNRTSVADKESELVADNIAFDDRSGFGQAQGDAIYTTKDSSDNRTTIFAGDIKFNRNAKSFLASLKPVMLVEQERDSLFIAADTFYSARLSALRRERPIPVIRDSAYLASVLDIQKKDTSSDRFFEAYFNVRIYSDSMQAVGDSLFYSFQDSTFRLFRNPAIWMNENQVTGDTIYLFTMKKKPERLYVFENGLAVSKVKGDYFNQVKGRTINGYFQEGNIDYLRARGAAESVYYVVDEDSAFIGVNKSTSDVIDMYFENREPHKVVFRNDLKGTTYPMQQVNHTELRLKGFRWLESRRPRSWQELLKR